MQRSCGTCSRSYCRSTRRHGESDGADEAPAECDIVRQLHPVDLLRDTTDQEALMAAYRSHIQWVGRSATAKRGGMLLFSPDLHQADQRTGARIQYVYSIQTCEPR